MMKMKQTTLDLYSTRPSNTASNFVDLDDDDEIFALAVEESLKEIERSSNAATDQPGTSTSSYFSPKLAASMQSLDGLDAEAARTWVYPTNKTIRNYQLEICKTALFYNTLVTLPTGLGKTFIAAVVMYNFYRWYPKGKTVFMAHTKPLVAQQIAACYEIMGIPQEDMTEMTGSIQPADRIRKWREKRIFFLTPQVMMNDLTKKLFDAKSVKCLVVDEAHKATGNFAYCQVVRELLMFTKQFRILALSATPGRNLQIVQQVITNLLIAKLELRSEDMPEIQKHTFDRTVEKVVVPLDAELRHLEQLFMKVFEKYTMPLNKAKLLPARDNNDYDKFTLLQARDRMRQNPPGNLQGQKQRLGNFEFLFAASMSLAHGYELLLLHGQKSLYKYLNGILEGDKINARLRSDLARNQDFCEIMQHLQQKFGLTGCLDNSLAPNSSFFASSTQMPMNTQQLASKAGTSHPKLGQLVEILVDHFRQFQADGQSTRVMVFSQYRESVEEITSVLKKHEPLIKPMKFVGHSSNANGTAKGFTQKEQLRVVREFQTGSYNTLVATCVGEEGLDLAEVDLIVCYDAPKSPVRLVQRMGRTGRKRAGRIVLLLTEGKEEQMYKRSEASRSSVYKAICSCKKFGMYANNPRMVPLGFTPQCVQKVMAENLPFDGARARRKDKLGGVWSKSGVEFLTSEENEELKRKFGGNTREVRAKRLKRRGKHEENAEEDFLDLGKYVLWQNEVQPTFRVRHSTTSELFVGLMRKLNYFNELPTNSGTEMLFFDSGVAAASPTRNSADIRRFLKNSPSSPQFLEPKKETSAKVMCKKTKGSGGRSKKKLATAAVKVDSQSCIVDAAFNAEDFYSTSSGEKILLKDVFPCFSTKKEENRAEFGRFEKKRTELPLAPLKLCRFLPVFEENWTNLDVNLIITENFAEKRENVVKSESAEKLLDENGKTGEKATQNVDRSRRTEIFLDSTLCENVEDLFSSPSTSNANFSLHMFEENKIRADIPEKTSFCTGALEKKMFKRKTLSPQLNFDFSFDFGFTPKVVEDFRVTSKVDEDISSDVVPPSPEVNRIPASLPILPRSTSPVGKKLKFDKTAFVDAQAMSDDDDQRPGPSYTVDQEESPIFKSRFISQRKSIDKPLAKVRPFKIGEIVVEQEIESVDEDLVESPPIKRRKIPTRIGGNQFIDDEVEQTLMSGVSSDESDEADDEFDDSFVDHASQPEFFNTQRRIESPGDMHAVYLKSMRSPLIGRRNKFKLAYGVGRDLNVCSQIEGEEAEDDEEDELACDSFVVPNDFVEYATEKKKVKSGRRRERAKSKPRRLLVRDSSDSDSEIDFKMPKVVRR